MVERMNKVLIENDLIKRNYREKSRLYDAKFEEMSAVQDSIHQDYQAICNIYIPKKNDKVDQALA